jgi:hypothetical protein
MQCNRSKNAGALRGLGRGLCVATGVLTCACAADGMDIPETESPPANEDAYGEVSDPTDEVSDSTDEAWSQRL